MPSLPHFAAVFAIGFTVIAISVPALSLNEPATVTSSYEVLEPETWVGKELPILEHIDIADKIKTGNWLLLFYHHGCPDCKKAIVELEKMARDFKSDEVFLKIALVEIPPYSEQAYGSIEQISSLAYGKLDTSKEWFVTIPTAMLIQETSVQNFWEEKLPDFEQLLDSLTAICLTFNNGSLEKQRGVPMEY